MGLFIQCTISGSFTFLDEGVVIICFVLTCLSELLALLCTQRGCLVDDLICSAVHIKSYCHSPCVPNHISNYGLLKECFELNVGSYHWEISCISALQSLWVFFPLPRCISWAWNSNFECIGEKAKLTSMQFKDSASLWYFQSVLNRLTERAGFSLSWQDRYFCNLFTDCLFLCTMVAYGVTIMGLSPILLGGGESLVQSCFYSCKAGVASTHFWFDYELQSTEAFEKTIKAMCKYSTGEH